MGTSWDSCKSHFLLPLAYGSSIHSQAGHINLFTVRHEPGRLIHVLNHHSAPVSAMSMDYGEKGFFSASWDGEAIVSEV